MSKSSKKHSNKPPNRQFTAQPSAPLNTQNNPPGTVYSTTAELYVGPIPPPEVLERIDALVPGGAERIISMAEKQLEHRHTIEKTFVDSNAKNFPRGQRFGFMLGLAGIGSGTYLAAIGQSLFGFAWMLVSIGTLIGVYMHGNKTQKKLQPPISEPSEN